LEGPLWQNYVYTAELFVAFWILIFAIKEIRKPENSTRKTELILATGGILAFLISFSVGNIAGSLGTDWELGQYGLFGMPVFVALLTFIMVRYQLFKAKVLATEALVVGLGILIISQMFVRKLEDVLVIAVVTLIITLFLGVLLIRSVKSEIEQRKKLESLTKDLEQANTRLKELDKVKSEFVSIASHQLRSPITAIRGYTSLLLEGSFGKFPIKAREALERIDVSAKHMTISIEDYLNVSRIESGNMKYEFSDFNLKEEVSNVCDDVRPSALKKGLVLLFRSDLKSRAIVNADLNKVVQISHNLINNSLKYTPKGTITVFLRDNTQQKRIYVDVIDTGVGMTEETISSIFQKFTRAKDASKVNTAGTGLGLFVALKMAEAMGGTITAHSEGEGKGSRFTLELPLQL